MNFVKALKWLTVVISVLTSLAICLGLLPPYKTLTRFDMWLWMSFFTSTAALQVYFLLSWKNCFCAKRLWSDFIVQASGVMYIIFACMFGAKYPPFTWAMAAYPIFAIICIFFGKRLVNRSQAGLEDNGNERIFEEH